MNNSWKTQLEELAGLARNHDLDTIVLRDPLNLSWFTGARWHVPQTLSPACFDIVVEGVLDPNTASIRVVTNRIEAPRLADTEFQGRQVIFDAVDWFEDRAARLPRGIRTGSDTAGDSWINVGEQLAGRRRVLNQSQIDVLTELSEEAAAVAGATARKLKPNMTEHQIAGAIQSGLTAAGMDCIALFVGSDERLVVHRHPLPTDKKVQDKVMFAFCARRDGLVSSVTRMVSFTPLGAQHETYRSLLEVERAFLDASTPGANLGEVFKSGAGAYALNGFAEDEWRKHHQGGITGFNPRELIANPTTSMTLKAGMVLGWNPSGKGFKVEDTTLVTALGAKPLAVDPTWPVEEIGGRLRPSVLEIY